jgi:hypothetical protein
MLAGEDQRRVVVAGTMSTPQRVKEDRIESLYDIRPIARHESNHTCVAKLEKLFQFIRLICQSLPTAIRTR